MHKAQQYNKQQFRDWNEQMAKEYDPDHYHESSSGIIAWIEGRRVRTILRMLNARKSDRLLEVGVGGGNILVQVKSDHLAGIDISPYLLEKARKRLGSHVALIEGDAENLEQHFAPGSLDKVFCSEVLEHVQRPDRVLQQMAQVLKIDGIAVVSVPNEAVINNLKSLLKKLGVFRILFPQVADHMEDEWHLTQFSKSLLRDLSEQDFIVERIRAVPFFFLPIRYVAMLRPRPSRRDLEKFLCCPSCKQLLQKQERTLRCAECGVSYCQKGRRFIFVSEEILLPSNSERLLKDFFKRWPWLYNILFAVVGPALLTGITSSIFIRRFRSGERILYAGSGPRRLPGDALNVDVLPFPGVDVVADLRYLPFADDTFDAVTCEQVLEHVASPHRAVAELRRVTRPGGFIHVAVPFVFPWHPSPFDYTRWTLDGLQDLFPDCAVVEKGVMAGPFSAFLAFMSVFLATILSLGIRPLQVVLQYVFLVLLAPVKLFDLLYARIPGASDCAADVYIIVRTPAG